MLNFQSIMKVVEAGRNILSPASDKPEFRELEIVQVDLERQLALYTITHKNELLNKKSFFTFTFFDRDTVVFKNDFDIEKHYQQFDNVELSEDTIDLHELHNRIVIPQEFNTEILLSIWQKRQEILKQIQAKEKEILGEVHTEY